MLDFKSETYPGKRWERTQLKRKDILTGMTSPASARGRGHSAHSAKERMILRYWKANNTCGWIVKATNKPWHGKWPKAYGTRQTTTRNRPDITTGLTRAQPPYRSKTTTYVSWFLWQYGQYGNLETKNSINNRDVAPNETREVLKGLLTDLVGKSWNATRFMEGGRRLNRQCKLCSVWADKRFAEFDLKQVRPSNYLNGMWPGSPT